MKHDKITQLLSIFEGDNEERIIVEKIKAWLVPTMTHNFKANAIHRRMCNTDSVHRNQ